jgi:hypothetical protein
VRLALSLPLAAFVIGFSIVVALQPDNLAADVMAETVLIVASGFTVVWMISLALGYRRRRR